MSMANSDKVDRIVKFLSVGPTAQKPVLFVGSGASIDAGLSSWDSLLGKLRDLTNTTIQDKSLGVLKLADRAKAKYPDEYAKILRESFRNERSEPGELDECLASLRGFLRFVVTPNYDKLLETAFRVSRLGIDPPVVTRLDDARALNVDGEFFIYKIHGDIDSPDSIILGEDDYTNVDYTSIFDFIQGFPILFVGYGMQDPILEDRLLRAIKMNKAAHRLLYLVKKDEKDRLNETLGKRAVTYNNFTEQKQILRDVREQMVANPFGKVRATSLQPDASLQVHQLMEDIKNVIPNCAGRMLIIHENWEHGWDSGDFVYQNDGQHVVPDDAGRLVGQFSGAVPRPWLGKMAFTGLVPPVIDRPGRILVKDSTYEQYRVLWEKLDDPIDGGVTLRRRWWLPDVMNLLEGSNLPHICCCHVALLTSDHKLLLTRKSRHSDFAGLSWCPSFEEQAANGPGKGPDGKPTIDPTPEANVLRGLLEEMNIPSNWVDELRFYALATDWKYSDLAIISTVRLNRTSADVFPASGADFGEFERDGNTRIQYLWTSASEHNITKLLHSPSFGADQREGPWHPSSKARFFAVMTAMVRWGWTTWPKWDETTRILHPAGQ